MTNYRPLIIAGSLMLMLSWIGRFDAVMRWLQFPSGWLAAFFLGAPVELDANGLCILTHPRIVVGAACSGIRFYAFIAGLGGAYWCGRRLWRWLFLLPICYGITLVTNAARIVMAWQFRRFSAGHIPEWLQEYVHMGIGIVCFLSVTALLLYTINFHPRAGKESA